MFFGDFYLFRISISFSFSIFFFSFLTLNMYHLESSCQFDCLMLMLIGLRFQVGHVSGTKLASPQPLHRWNCLAYHPQTAAQKTKKCPIIVSPNPHRTPQKHHLVRRVNLLQGWIPEISRGKVEDFIDPRALHTGARGERDWDRGRL